MTRGTVTHLHLDLLGGAAGDMFVAALARAFPDLVPRILADVAAVLPEGLGAATFTEGTSGGLSCARFGLVLNDGQSAHRHGPETTYSAMRARIEAAPLSEGTATQAQAILHRVAVAEAAIHDIPIDRVHFHELADWDSLMDVTAAGSICAALDGCRWSVGPLPLGGGRVKTAHGPLFVPAPATLAILEDYEWVDDGVGGERVTPTGAAILAHVTGGAGNGSNPGGRLVATGSGAGTRDLPGMANVLRVSAFGTGRQTQSDRVLQLACDCDDMTGEELGWATDRLRASDGVRDVLLLNGQGKKGRPVFRIELLADPDAETELTARIFDLTTTLGVRRTLVTRHLLTRRADTGPGGLPRKLAERPSGTTAKVESDALAPAATLAERRAMALGHFPEE